MAASLPAALKTADVQRFAIRAAQLEKYKPIATYWLEYYILQRILGGSLHTSSEEVSGYAVQLMDKLEQTKETFATEAAVTDDTAAKAYMEQFATETFDRAEAAQNSDKVTKQTVDTFQAAATFYDSLSIWGELDSESKAKSKFAKFHALRIVRALKEGKDPNASNPKVELPAVASTSIDEDAELRQLEREVDNASSSLQPTVEDTSEGKAPSGKDALQQAVSPMDVDTSTADRPVSIGGGYFPGVPSTTGRSASTADFSTPHVDEETHIPRQATIADMMSPNIDDETHVPAASTADPAQFYARAAPAPSLPPPQAVPTANIKVDDDAIMAAQKHAKWAISALNFEDVPTAIRELRLALQKLGGL